MKNFPAHLPLAILAVLGSLSTASAIEPTETIPVWPGEPPGRSNARGEERKVEGRPRPFYQLTDISKPTVSVFLPPKEQRTGAALLVLPGGGLQRLAYEHEGLEVAEWAVGRGIAAFVLKYRVPAPATAGTQDAQRALSLIRARAGDWDVDPDNVGVMGFSAGGEIAAWMVTHYDERQYQAVDAIDSFSCRPDFAAMIYPGGLMARGTGGIKEPIGSRINRGSSPMFFVHASDDSAENSLAYAVALKQARVPVELHLYRDGGHGFGVRTSGSPAGTWPARFEGWMRSLGFLDKAIVRKHVRDFSGALNGDGQLPRFPESATLDDAFMAQKRFVRLLLKDDSIAGFKGGVVTEAAQKSHSLTHPVTGVLFGGGRLNATDKPVINLSSAPDTMVETEIGYVIGVDISYAVLNDTQAREAVQNLVPVIELPVSYRRRMGTMTPKDMVASNIGSARYIVGTAKDPAVADANALKVSLKRDGQMLHEAIGGSVKGGQWANLRLLLNQITAQGHTVRAGSVIISGALGAVQPGEPGKYFADFGELGSIEFELKK